MASTPSASRRVFVDSSVLFAAALSEHGPARQLLVSGLQRSLRLFVSDLVLEETKRNLLRKAPRALPFFDLLHEIFEAWVVNPTEAQVRRAAHSVEPKDAPIVAAAVAAEAQYLATHDARHLLRHRELIATHFGVVVASPDEVLAATK